MPDSARLAEPATSTTEKARIRARVGKSLTAAKNVAERNTQREAHADHHKARDKVMRDLRRDARGKPVWGEPKRLAKLHQVPVTQVRKWIEQLRRPLRAGGDALPDDWRTVYYGDAVRYQAAAAVRRRHKKRAD